MVTQATQDRLEALEEMQIEIEQFKTTRVYSFFATKMDQWIADEHRDGWDNQETKPADMKLAQARFHALTRARRVFDLVKDEIKSIQKEMHKESLDHPMFEAGEEADDDNIEEDDDEL